jgi:hypothetical protein
MADNTFTAPGAATSSSAASRSSQETAKSLASAEKWPTDYLIYALCVATIAAMLYMAANNAWDKLSFNTEASLSAIFGAMLLVALFVERVIEVFVSVWIDRGSAIHEQNLDYWQKYQGRLAKEMAALISERNGEPKPDAARIAAIDEALAKKREEMTGATAYADVEAKALLPFQARTLKVSTWIGLVVGTLAAAVGFRFMGQLVVLPLDPHFKASIQYQWFVGTDILLTGAVLAGGSKLVHEIFSVYSSFMSTTSKALSDQSKTQ